LAPSTISQHLKELQKQGKIVGRYDEHFKNTKYYELAEVQKVSARTRPTSLKITFACIALVVLAVSGISFIALMHTASGRSQRGRYVEVSLTDPPIVPNGTTALTLSYSRIELVLANTTGVSIAKLDTNGSVNLLSLINASSVLGEASLPSNSEIESADFYIQNVTITINNSTHPVALPKKEIEVQVSDNGTANSTLLLDFTPTVYMLYSNNSTSFVMLPSARAEMINGFISKTGYARKGGEVATPFNDSIRKAFLKAQPEINVTGASLTSTGGSTELSVTVQDDSNNSAVVTSVWVMPIPQPYNRSTAIGPNAIMTEHDVMHNGLVHPLHFFPPILEASKGSRPIVLAVEENGTLRAPSRGSSLMSSGFVLQPGQNKTFQFNITSSNTLGNQKIVGGSRFRILVGADYGYPSQTEITAS
jgi:hypothetical protein